MIAYLLFRFLYNFFSDLEDLIRGLIITLIIITIILFDIIIYLLWPENDEE